MRVYFLLAALLAVIILWHNLPALAQTSPTATAFSPGMTVLPLAATTAVPSGSRSPTSRATATIILPQAAVTPTAHATHVTSIPPAAPVAPATFVASATPVAPLPDLIAYPPYDLQLLVNTAAGTRLLRFSNTFANIGSAALDLVGEMQTDGGATGVTQVMLIQRGPGANGTAPLRRLGGFDYHPEHGHWHWQGFSVYEIWSLGLNAHLEEAQIVSGKVGYCMMDYARANLDRLDSQGHQPPAIPIAARRYTSCGWRQQGISPGWEDTYQHYLPGQSLDVSDLPDGIYALRTAVDPQGLLAEADASNNTALVYFRLDGAHLQVIDDPRLARAQLFRLHYGHLPVEEPKHNARR